MKQAKLKKSAMPSLCSTKPVKIKKIEVPTNVFLYQVKEAIITYSWIKTAINHIIPKVKTNSSRINSNKYENKVFKHLQ